MEPAANDKRPWTNTKTNAATSLPARNANSSQPAGNVVPVTTSRRTGWLSATRPPTATPAKEPMPNSASAAGTHGAASPATLVITGAKYVYVAKVPPLTSAPRTSVTIRRRERSARTSCSALGAAGSAAVGGTVRRIAMTGGTDSTAMAQNAARHPQAPPSRAPRGTPATQAMVTPDNSTDVARPLARGSTMAAAVASPTARKPALASAATTRVPSSSAKLVVAAPRTCISRKVMRKSSSARRRGQRRPSSATSGAPTIMPAAKADVSHPAAGRDTESSAAMAGTRPGSMNSDVPWAKTASPRA